MEQFARGLYVQNRLGESKVTSAELTLFYVGSQVCKGGHFHIGVRDHYLIHFISKGRGYFQFSGTRYDLCAGMGFTIFPDTIAEYRADPDEPWVYDWIGFHGALAEHHLDALGISHRRPCFSCSSGQAILRCLRGRKPANPLTDQALVYNFLGILSRELYREPQNDRARYVYNAIEFIRRNYSQPISIQEIADFLGIDRSHLFSLFREQIGKSPKQYLTEFRIEAACELLLKRNVSVKLAARSVGFSDELYFSRVFKQRMGLSPRTYLRSLPSTPRVSESC